MIKKCSSCLEEKNVTDFRKDKTRTDGRQPYCKVCARARASSDYVNKYRDTLAVVRKRKLDKSKQQLLEYKLAHPCVVCGETSPCCLDFHHIDPNTKEFEISQNLSIKWDRILAEINKCMVLCSNCHRKFHAGIIALPE
jgi:hypothetical protein